MEGGGPCTLLQVGGFWGACDGRGEGKGEGVHVCVWVHTTLTWGIWEGVIGADGRVGPRPLLVGGRETEQVPRHSPQTSACVLRVLPLVHRTEPVALREGVSVCVREGGSVCVREGVSV